jgi:beta-ketoacyl-acyl-carrier-protein synthase II
MTERVVITGLGTINPLGHTVRESWQNALAGVAGVGPLTHFDPSGLKVQIACQVKDFNPQAHLGSKEARRRDRFEQFAAVAARQALDQSGLEITPDLAGRVGAVISSSGGGLGSLQDSFDTLRERGPNAISPFATPMYMSSGAAGLASIDLGAQGPAFSVSSACASASDGIGMAWLMIRTGMVDAVLAGGSDAPIVQMVVAAIDRSGAMSHRPLPDPQSPRPFDLERDGFVIGEGAAILMLESERFARQRGAEILAELAGYGASADAFHITAPLEDGRVSAISMRSALDAAGVNPAQVDYINAHGTGTELNDVSETRAIKSVFGERASRLPVSSTKSMTGHIMGTTAALEALFCVMAVQDGAVPPTIHYHTPDPDCDLDYVPNEARQLPLGVVMTNAFGFAGHNSCLVLRRYK